MPSRIWRHCKRWPINAAARCNGRGRRRNLRHSQRRFYDLFENSPDAIFVEDLERHECWTSNCQRLRVARVDARRNWSGKNAVEDLVPLGAAARSARAQFPAPGQQARFPGSKARVFAPTAGACRWKSASCTSSSTASRRCCFTSATSASGTRRKWRCAVRKLCSARSGKIPWTACG